MLHGILNMPLPDDPPELQQIEWLQFRQAARQASAEITRLTSELRDARMQAIADGAQWQDDVARLTAEREAAVAAALEAAAERLFDFTPWEEVPGGNLTPDTFDEGLSAAYETVLALATDTQRNALAERDRRMRAGWARLLANEILAAQEEHRRTFPDPGFRAANVALGCLRRLSSASFPETRGFGNEETAALLARADEIERGETA